MQVGDELRKYLGDKLKEHESLKEYTTMKVGGVADYFYVAENIEELVKAVQAAVNADIDYFVIGGGSNVIISDYGFPGLVILDRSQNVAFLKDKTQAIADSGVYISHLITKSAAQEQGGLEFMIGIPGTVGGAVYGNVACWGGTISEYIRSVTLLIPGEEKGEKCRMISMRTEEMKFGYRASAIKQMPLESQGRKPVVLSVKFQLTNLRREEIMRRIKNYQEMRISRQPLGEFSCGSIFKNPSGQSAGVDPEDGKQMSAGYLIDAVGGKKFKVGGAIVSKKHANFILNSGRATAHEVRELIEQIKEKVRDIKGIDLREEVEFVGQWSQGGEIVAKE